MVSWHFSLRSSLTSSQSHGPRRRTPKTHIHGVFQKRPQIRQRRDSLVRTIAKTPPPAFLFPNQRCQRPRPACRPHRLAPGGGGGGYLVAPNFRVNRPFPAFRFAPKPRNKTQKSLGAAEGLPSPVRSDSIEAREHIHLAEKIKGVSASRSPLRPAPEGVP